MIRKYSHGTGVDLFENDIRDLQQRQGVYEEKLEISLRPCKLFLQPLGPSNQKTVVSLGLVGTEKGSSFRTYSELAFKEGTSTRQTSFVIWNCPHLEVEVTVTAVVGAGEFVQLTIETKCVY